MAKPLVGERPPGWTSDDWATPWQVVDEYVKRFGPFDLDACAQPETAKAPAYYTKAMDGLRLPWIGKVWLNPPYSDPGPWLWKARWEIKKGRASLVVALLPAATDTAWFHDYVLPHAAVEYRRGRIRFLGWEGTPIGSPKSPSIVAIYRRSA